MGRRIGSGLYATKLSTSKANQELVPKGIQFYATEFVPASDCNIIVNDNIKLPVVGKVGIKTNHKDVIVYSLKIVEANIQYLFGGKY